jgi:hypothetical protein
MGTPFTDRAPSNEEAEAAAEAYWAARGEPRLWLVPAVDPAGERHGIERRTTTPHHPLGDRLVAVPAGPARCLGHRWTNGQAERRSRTLKDAPVRRYHDGSHDELRRHLRLFLDADNHARRLKTLRGLTPYEVIGKNRTDQPTRFRTDPTHLTPGPNI